MKIAVCSHGDAGMTDWKAFSFPNFQRYCDKHNYTFIGSSKQFDDRHPSWARLPMIFNIIHKYDWVMWIDPDALIINTDKKIEDYLSDDFSFRISKTGVINHGVWYVKNSPLGIRILQDTYNQTQFIEHMWRENQACIHLFNEVYTPETMDNIRIDINADYNVFAKNYNQGDFVIHFPGEHKNYEQFKQMSRTIKY